VNYTVLVMNAGSKFSLFYQCEHFTHLKESLWISQNHFIQAYAVLDTLTPLLLTLVIMLYKLIFCSGILKHVAQLLFTKRTIQPFSSHIVNCFIPCLSWNSTQHNTIHFTFIEVNQMFRNELLTFLVNLITILVIIANVTGSAKTMACEHKLRSFT